MSIQVNGRPYDIATPTTVEALLLDLDQPRDDIAIAVDGAVVPRSTWPEAKVGDGAVVEIVTARQGG
ncbi:MAG: sulfur carrier protein ThiS [Nocardioidaceae bacterium]